MRKEGASGSSFWALPAKLVGEVESYGNVFRFCYVRGPEGNIVELAERLG